MLQAFYRNKHSPNNAIGLVGVLSLCGVVVWGDGFFVWVACDWVSLEKPGENWRLRTCFVGELVNDLPPILGDWGFSWKEKGKEKCFCTACPSFIESVNNGNERPCRVEGRPKLPQLFPFAIDLSSRGSGSGGELVTVFWTVLCPFWGLCAGDSDDRGVVNVLLVVLTKSQVISPRETTVGFGIVSSRLRSLLSVVLLALAGNTLLFNLPFFATESSFLTKDGASAFSIQPRRPTPIAVSESEAAVSSRTVRWGTENGLLWVGLSKASNETPLR